MPIQDYMTDRTYLIIALLNRRWRAAEIGRLLDLTRERIRQIIRDDIDPAHLRIPCAFCGDVMTPERGLVTICHEHCQEALNKRHKRTHSRLHHSWQRESPDGHFEGIALDEYDKRGYDVLHMPGQCEFDYVINGLRIDVKGANPGTTSKWQFGMAAAHRNYFVKQGWEYSKPHNMAERCDVVHCIGREQDSYYHFLIPSAAIGTLTGIVIKLALLRGSKWAQWEGRWDLLGA